MKFMATMTAAAAVLAFPWLASAQDLNLEEAAEYGSKAAQRATAAAAAEAAANDLTPQFSPNGRRIKVGSYTIENRWLPIRKIQAGDKAFWREFMHGQNDAETMPVLWSQLTASKEALAPYTPAVLPLSTTLKYSEFPPLALNGGQELLLDKPLFSATELKTMRGEIVRVFVWIQADSTGIGQ